ncbi:helix-turn-helix domain-containing protein [Bacillus sp. FSL W8-0645]|uniref:helix-turn-helix domain-containing protein n=1 Tax=Bacillus TaxID=1386 RepID=UPI0007EE991E|nr:helix-turn-helix domain-containing protein [Bacillus pumilus]MBB6601443.1 helix-turn-helix domain-containing protein [Bacillus pumilus]MBU8575533.1 helix-turn-helix domain-containing protein [Bacillus pumilus]MBU8609844.1 helix-turn-helix domain-containing protein [Bacillus pumilus]MDX5483408.1 helix-turn-helix domain-containing protein [Bacillus pumilus]MED1111329.1 helix-turn-helix domain-containing protein [Bacillus pumilus]
MKRRQYKFYYKLVTFFFMLSTIPVIIVGIFSYQHSQKTALENISNEKLDSVKQTQSNIEHILKTVDHSLTHYVSSPPLLQTLAEPLNPDQFQLYNQVQQELNYLQTFDTDLSNITLVSKMEDWYMNNSGLYHVTSGDQEKALTSYLNIPSHSSWALEENNPLVATKEGKASFCKYNVNLIKQLPMNSVQKKGIAVASIPSCMIADNMPDFSQSDSMFVIDTNGKVLLHNRKEQIGESLKNQEFVKHVLSREERSGQFNMKIEELNYQITFQKSDYNEWTYLSFVSIPELKAQTKSIGWITFIICFILLALSLLFSWFGSRHFYKPIRLLYESFARNESFLQKQPFQNEFELIESSIKQMKDQNNDLEERIEQQVTHLQQYFMVRLLLGKLTEEEINNRFQSLGFPQDWSHLSMLVTQIDTLKGTPYEKKDADLLLFAINGLIEQIIPQEEHLQPTVVNQHQTTIILNHSKSDEEFTEYLNQLAETIQLRIEEQLGLSISIGISRQFQELTMAKQAYIEGKEALKYRLKAEKKSIILYEHIQQGKTFKTHFPKQLQHDLFDAMKAGDQGKADHYLHVLLQSIFSKNAGPHEYHIALARFLNNLIELMHLLGIELFEVEDNKMLYDTIFEFKTFEDTEAWLKHEIIRPIIDQLGAREESQYKNISEKIIHIIHQEFDSDLTLDEIATRLHYNPNYLSSIFRKEMDISFSEYLSSYRHHVAKNWLVETDMSVKEISEKLKYKNPQNFIRSFKKLEGTTPGKYRDQKKGI